ncbi:MAG: hypothetical protein ACK46X_08340 [Candidatus Sericytochromatia bacterium]
MSTASPESLESLLLGAAEVLPSGGLEAKLKEVKGRPLRVKLGFDPTKPDHRPRRGLVGAAPLPGRRAPDCADHR